MALATVKGGFWGDISADYDPIDGDSPGLARIAQEFKKEGLRDQREINETLNGVAPGATALATYKRAANAVDLGGLRTIETITAINRATVAADVTKINNDMLIVSSQPTTYAANGDGNPRGFPGG